MQCRCGKRSSFSAGLCFISRQRQFCGKLPRAAMFHPLYQQTSSIDKQWQLQLRPPSKENQQRRTVAPHRRNEELRSVSKEMLTGWLVRAPLPRTAKWSEEKGENEKIPNVRFPSLREREGSTQNKKEGNYGGRHYTNTPNHLARQRSPAWLEMQI